jgi:hypothetical protein
MLLSQAIRSGDEKTIDDLISKTDSEDIEKCTRDLRIEHVLPFLQTFGSMMRRGSVEEYVVLHFLPN